jgi:hypothetical protein
MSTHTSQGIVETRPKAACAIRLSRFTFVAVAGLLGTAIETYDTVIYGKVATFVAGRLQHSSVDPVAYVTIAVAGYTVKFLMRHVGAVYWNTSTAQPA